MGERRGREGEEGGVTIVSLLTCAYVCVRVCVCVCVCALCVCVCVCVGIITCNSQRCKLDMVPDVANTCPTYLVFRFSGKVEHKYGYRFSIDLGNTGNHTRTKVSLTIIVPFFFRGEQTILSSLLGR